MGRKLPPPIHGDRVVFDKYVELGRCAAKTAAFYSKGKPNVYPSRKQVAAAVKRHEDGTSAEYWTNSHKKPGGRPPYLDKIAFDNLRAAAQASALRRDFIRPLNSQCDELIKQERKKMLVRLQFEDDEELINMQKYPISDKTLNRYKDQIWPSKEKANYIAEHRDIVKAEIRNSISCLAVAGFTFSSTNPECIATSDHFAVRRNPNGDIQVIRTADGSQELMRSQNLQAGHDGGDARAADTGASVTLPIHATMTKAMKMVSIVSEVWDDQIRPLN
jgi:hypothetical protein